MDNSITVKCIEKLQVKGKIVTVMVDDEPITKLITTVSFDYEGAPGRFDDVLSAMAAGHEVDVSVSSPQSRLGIDRVTITGAGQSVTLDRKTDDNIAKILGT